MSHTVRDKKKLTTRVSKIQGQVNGLKKMLDEEQQCADVLQQIAAIRGAVNGLMREMIKGHITEHIVLEDNIEKREADLEVVLSVLNSYIK
ncbi:Ni(II)/Co(II)-binding transcriptional repressor RcnR [Vibrio sp. S4M6]|uniref:Ni(II)/Co(II)-binding transcriptional repressor RcnR n=1 Tax=Vibrio sinus TaxID=2946865 RepID=UPI00202A642E|nr:Ni(II)/Co(II)-binding transcriptional repressor RcnR [Vibrio sinus]MCL9782870.1 Ni(II)/Co(II)-binding transcriptional repressor RcnR [Vibrio sinus]